MKRTTVEATRDGCISFWGETKSTIGAIRRIVPTGIPRDMAAHRRGARLCAPSSSSARRARESPQSPRGREGWGGGVFQLAPKLKYTPGDGEGGTILHFVLLCKGVGKVKNE